MLFQDQQNMLNQEHVLQNHGDHEGFSCNSRNMPQTHSIHTIPLGRTRTYHPWWAYSAAWAGTDQLIIYFHYLSQRTLLCKSKSKMSMQEPTVAVWSVGDAWNMSQMAHICMLNTFLTSQGWDMIWPINRDHMITLAPHKNQGFTVTEK